MLKPITASMLQRPRPLKLMSYPEKLGQRNRNNSTEKQTNLNLSGRTGSSLSAEGNASIKNRVSLARSSLARSGLARFSLPGMREVVGVLARWERSWFQQQLCLNPAL